MSQAQAQTPISVAEPNNAVASVSIDPYEAYAQGRYADAFDGFANLQVKRPKDVDLMLNIGAALYRLKDYAGAQKAWSLAAEHGDPNIRAQALYDLGNSAFQQQHLEEAIQHYQSALSLDPNDEDAQANLSLTKKRLEAQNQKQDETQDPNASNPPQDANASSEGDTPNSGEGHDTHQDGNQVTKPQDANGPAPDDPNGAGSKPKSHDTPDAQDGRQAGPADKQPESDPNSEGGAEAPSATTEPQAGQEGEKTKRMPRSQAERMLDAMGESRPRHAPPKDRSNQRPADGMDW